MAEKKKLGFTGAGLLMMVVVVAAIIGGVIYVGMQ